MTLSFPARLAGLLTLALGGCLLTACEDPSGVGLTILDPGETDPRARVFPAQAELAPLLDLTGLTTRALAGRAEDPIFGTVEAVGYMDFRLPDLPPPPASYFTTPVDRIILNLRLDDYRYGEAQGVAVYDLYEVAEAWNSALLPSDTTLALHNRRLASFDVAPGDTLVQVELPRDWVAERDTLFRSLTFDQAFHGFQLRPRPESRAALGFEGTLSSLLVLSTFEGTPDTVAVIGSQVFSGVERTLPGALPPQLLPLQDGTGIGLHLAFGLETLAEPLAVTAAFIRLEADTTLATTGTEGFIRPLARTISLYGLRGGADPIEIGQATLDARTQSYVFTSAALSREFQQLALQRGQFTGFAVGFPRTPSTLNVAPIVTSGTAPPRLVLLVVPTD